MSKTYKDRERKSSFKRNRYSRRKNKQFKNTWKQTDWNKKEIDETFNDDED